jgi:hypothetical protein
MKRILFLLLVFTFSSCVTDKVNTVELKFNRFEKALFSVTPENIDIQLKILENDFGTFNEVFETQIMQKGEMSESAYLKELLAFVNHPDMREAYDSLMLLFSDISEIEKELNTAFTFFHNEFPSYPTPELTTFFGGFNYGVVTYDNNIAIGLEHFLGKNSKFYKLLGNPEYLRFQQQEKFITANVMEVWLNEYFQQYMTSRDLLSQMIYKGKVMYCIDKMLPKISFADKFRFTQEQMEWVIDNEANIWSYFIENELLYSSHEQEFRTFLHYSPFAKGMPDDAPARVAYFIGYKMVNEFMDNNKMDIEQLMYLTNSRQFLKRSKYKPTK